MYMISKLLFTAVTLFCGAWFLLAAIFAIFTPLSAPIIMLLIGAPLFAFIALLPLRWLIRRNRARLQKMVNAYLDAQGLSRDQLGPIVSSDEKPTAMAFYSQGQVILASAQKGEHYVERFDIDEIGWREIRNMRGEYLGVEVFPPAQRPSSGTLKIWSGWTLPGEVRAIYGANGIPLP
ncbi:hypothetical protein [Chromohalobacter sp. 11-W]|uniref:hypothetical protein n=1 Tax=Chromohalobacter sp. 11-W TaxID=2994061 RepID=UPI0024692A8D|nr:hypothetical protein [Chromohalobacter sp. 11-W]